MEEKILLVDGHSLLFRAFYGMPLSMTAPDGTHTNAIYGFLSIFRKVMEEEKPNFVAVAFDTRKKTFRHEMFEGYKGTRKPAPPEFHEQLPVMKEVLDAMGIQVVTLPGFEADDILGTLARKAEAEGVAPRILSGDRDLLQIATEKTQIILPKTKGGETLYERYFADDVKREMGVTPAEFIDMKALMGDSSDNIPGLPGVGPKTASAIIAAYHSIENAKAHEAEITPKKARLAMEEHFELAELSKQLATICTDAPLEVSVRDLSPGDPTSPAVREIYRKLGFRSLLAAFAEKKEETKPLTFRRVLTFAEGEEILQRAAKAERIGLSVVAGKKEIYAVGLAFSEESVAFSVGGVFSEKELCRQLGELAKNVPHIASANVKELLKHLTFTAKAPTVTEDGWISSDVPEDIERLFGTAETSAVDPFEEIYSRFAPKKEPVSVETPGNETVSFGETLTAQNTESEAVSGAELRETPFCANSDVCDAENTCLAQDVSKYFDAVIAAYLIDPLKSDWDFGAIAGGYLQMTVPGRSELLGKKTPDEFLAAARKKGGEDKAMETIAEVAAMEAAVSLRAEDALLAKLRELEMEKLFREIEMPLVPVLAQMELSGIFASREALLAYGESLQNRIDALEAAIYEAAGETFNINSPKQLGTILFEKMHLPGGKKTKTGYSTAADVLEALAPDTPIVAKILEYRTYTKLKSTYADGLIPCIDADGRIRTSFNQTITATGRLSSTDPNLQNIPMRMELGRQIRKCFFPKEGCVFVDADYSQIELRILAHMSGDEKLIEAYKNARDIHRATAAEVFHVPFDEVTDELRRKAKAVNFGIVYGISSFGLSQGLSISRQEASAYIKEYFSTYPRIQAFLQHLVLEAKRTGAATSMFGRRRPVPELKSANFAQRSFGERIAMNSPIQGSAADIIKIAMVRVSRRLLEEQMQAKLILQIHDELLIEAPKEEAERAKAILEEEMKAAADLSVTLETDCHIGADWYEAK